MARKIKQFRYYSDEGVNKEKNQPSEINYKDYINGNVFSNYYPIVQLGVQTMPGVKFYLNNGIEPITIGITGIFEIDASDNIEITNLRFSADSMELISSNENTYLIVDIIYEEEG